MCKRHVSNSRCNEETGWTQSCGGLQSVRGPKPEPPVSGFHVCVFSIWVNVNPRACTLTPGCHSCRGLDRLMFLAQRSVAPLQLWWFSGLSWKSHTIHRYWSWQWTKPNPERYYASILSLKLYTLSRCLASAWLQCVFGFVFNSVKQWRLCFSHGNEFSCKCNEGKSVTASFITVRPNRTAAKYLNGFNCSGSLDYVSSDLFISDRQLKHFGKSTTITTAVTSMALYSSARNSHVWHVFAEKKTPKKKNPTANKLICIQAITNIYCAKYFENFCSVWQVLIKSNLFHFWTGY